MHVSNMRNDSDVKYGLSSIPSTSLACANLDCCVDIHGAFDLEKARVESGILGGGVCLDVSGVTGGGGRM